MKKDLKYRYQTKLISGSGGDIGHSFATSLYRKQQIARTMAHGAA